MTGENLINDLPLDALIQTFYNVRTPAPIKRLILERLKEVTENSPRPYKEDAIPLLTLLDLIQNFQSHETRTLLLRDLEERYAGKGIPSRHFRYP